MKRKAVKLKRCKQCRANFAPSNSMQKVCSPDCAIRFAQAETKIKADKAHLVRKREFKANDTSAQRKIAQAAFNAYIRYRDRNDDCISCDKDKFWHGQWHAGHFKTVGSRPDLRFDENNCNKQCSVCNNHLSGNVAEYRKKLIERIGLHLVEQLEKEGKPKRYRAEDYIAITKEYKLKLKSEKIADAELLL